MITMTPSQSWALLALVMILVHLVARLLADFLVGSDEPPATSADEAAPEGAAEAVQKVRQPEMRLPFYLIRGGRGASASRPGRPYDWSVDGL